MLLLWIAIFKTHRNTHEQRHSFLHMYAVLQATNRIVTPQSIRFPIDLKLSIIQCVWSPKDHNDAIKKSTMTYKMMPRILGVAGKKLESRHCKHRCAIDRQDHWSPIWAHMAETNCQFTFSEARVILHGTRKNHSTINISFASGRNSNVAYWELFSQLYRLVYDQIFRHGIRIILFKLDS